GIAALKPSGETFEEIEVEHDRQLIRQYVRFLLTRTGFLPPPWVVEGLTQVIMDIEVSERDIKIGRLDARRGAPLSPLLDPEKPFDVNSTATGDMTGLTTEAGLMVSDLTSSAAKKSDTANPTSSVGDRPFHVVLTHTALLPWDTFFAVTADAPEAANPMGDCLWAKQAYAFVHFCLFRADGKYRQAYATFVRRLANEPLSETLFSQCFQMSYQDLTRELRTYIAYPRHVFRHIKLAEEGKLVADLTFREATQGEVGRIKGDAQRLAGRHEDALLTLRTAYARGERDAALLAALGVAENHAGQTERARKFLEAAAKLGTDRPSAWVTLARLRLDEAKAAPAAAGELSAAQMAAVLAPLLKARALHHVVPEVYTTMAEAWMGSAAAPTLANIHVIGEGVTQFPSDSTLALHTAQLYARAGDPKNAAEVARLGARFAADAVARERFETYLAQLPPLAANP
ncbi:MAG: hypothetical protein C0522_14095, partial [Rhodocyclaceae bacterium]|nr:hypothetical protein [Rhodocyclaceae bacterium]